MNPWDEVVEFVATLTGAAVLVASEESGAPAIAWGDVFFYPTGDFSPPNMPFATIVTKDYPGFDEQSHLDLGGAFRLNLHVGREAFRSRFPDWDERSACDFAQTDVIVPHPGYWRHGWISIVNPSAASLEALGPALVEARGQDDTEGNARDAQA